MLIYNEIIVVTICIITEIKYFRKKLKWGYFEHALKFMKFWD